MSKQRVALLTYAIDNRPAKGTAIVARKYTEALLERPNEFEVTLLHYEPCQDPIYTHGAREVIFPTFRWSVLNRRSFRQLYYFITTHDRYDVMQWFQPRLYPFFWLAPARHILVTVHGAGDITAPHVFQLSRAVFNWTLRLGRYWVARAIAVSTYASQEIQQAYHISREKIAIIPNGVDTVFFHKTTEVEKERVCQKYGLPSRFLLNIGRHVPHKNVLRVIEAFEEATKRDLASDIHLVQVGTGGTDRVHIEACIHASSVRSRIHTYEFIEEKDLPVLYQLAEAFLFPSLNEGQGMPVLEAMASETPVLTSNTTSLKEIGEGAALLVDPENTSDIADGICRIIDDAARREALIHAGSERAHLFSWREAADKLYAVYRELNTL